MEMVTAAKIQTVYAYFLNLSENWNPKAIKTKKAVNAGPENKGLSKTRNKINAKNETSEITKKIRKMSFSFFIGKY